MAGPIHALRLAEGQMLTMDAGPFGNPTMKIAGA
jgi:hypothetical protein